MGIVLLLKRSDLHTVRNLHFLSKNSTLSFRENCRFFLGEKLVKMLWFLTVKLLTTLISREKLSKKIWGEKLVKMLGFCQNRIFGQKFDFSNSVSATYNSKSQKSRRESRRAFY